MQWNTPCNFKDRADGVRALAATHVEIVLSSARSCRWRSVHSGPGLRGILIGVEMDESDFRGRNRFLAPPVGVGGIADDIGHDRAEAALRAALLPIERDDLADQNRRS